MPARASHLLLIAAIFVPYVVLMGGLFAYIIRSGRHSGRDQDDGGEEGELPALPSVAECPA